MCTICSLTIEFAVEHPLTLAIAVATRQAIDTGLLPEGDTTDEMDMARSRHQAVVLLTAMQQRLEQVLTRSQLLALPNFFVLMIESRTWGYFHPTLGGFDVNANPTTPRLEPDENGVRDCVVVVSQAAAAQISRGALPFPDAADAGVVFVDAPDAQAVLVETAFAMAYAVEEFSDFVCTEVA
jgi:hypothetical protein